MLKIRWRVFQTLTLYGVVNGKKKVILTCIYLRVSLHIVENVSIFIC